MKLIKEEVNDVAFLTEASKDGKGKDYFIEGVFLQSEVKNRNGRVYPKKLLEREVFRYNRDYVQRNRAYGELGHPDTPSMNLHLVSHMITNLREQGNDYIGKAKVLDTPNGKIVKSLLEGGANLGVSTRGVGSLKAANGFQLVQDDYHLATAADIVADPSAPDCWVQGIMEGADWIQTPTGWQQVHVERARKLIKEASRSDVEAVAERLFRNFISKL